MEHSLSFLAFDSKNPWINGAFYSAIIIAIYVVFLALNRILIQKLLRRVVQAFKLSTEKTILATLDEFLRRSLLFLAVFFIVQCFPLNPRVELVVEDAIFIALTVLILLFTFDIFDVLGHHLSARGAAEFLPLFSKLFKTVFASFALMVVLRHFNYDIWHIVTALGIGSLAIGLAAQPTLSNMIAGFTLLIDRPFRPADRIFLASGSEGDVLHIGMRSTWIQNAEGNVLIVPNSELVTSKLINFNYPDTKQFQRLRFQFDCNQDVETIKGLLRKSTENISELSSDPPKVLCSGIIEGRLEISLIYRIETYASADAAKDKIIESSLKNLHEKDIKFAAHPYFVAATVAK